MVVRNSFVQVLGLATAGTVAVGTVAVVGLGYYFWDKILLREPRKKSVDSVDEEENKKIVTNKPIETKLLEQSNTTEKNDGNTINSPTEIDIQETDFKPTFNSCTETDIQENDFKPCHKKLVTISVAVPKERAREFVGIQGANIQKIQNVTNTKITSQREILDNGDRVYSIHGTSADVRLAEIEINKCIMSQPVLKMIKIDVPANAMDRIIGLNGENIRAIQKKSMAKLSAENSDDSNLSYGVPELSASKMRTIRIMGTEEQIEIAKGFIQESLTEENSLDSRKFTAPTRRTKRKAQAKKFPVRSIVSEAIAANHFPLKRDDILDVFVSWVYDPNNFCIQVVGSSSIDLDNLCQKMTEYYTNRSDDEDTENTILAVGDLVAAIFDDGRIYRARILEINGTDAKVVYVDYGDRRSLPISKLYRIRTEHLKLRFQAIEATLNFVHQEEWSEEIVNEFCNLAHCADWITITAKVKDYLKNEESHDIIWIELFDNHGMNIGDEIRRLLAIQSQSSLRNSGTYASVASVSGSVSNNELEVPSEKTKN